MQSLSSPADQPAPAAMPSLPAAPPKRRHVSASLLALVVALFIILGAVLLSGIPSLLSSPARNSSSIVDLHKTALLSVSMVSATEGWAVGTTNADPAQGVILHYHQGRWWQVANPYDAGELRSVSMLSASDGWIAGDKGTILHYNGSTWLRVGSPVHTTLGSVSMLSPDEG